jgi:hypothetical protein|tara:strand:+ start:359 stop:580 length:222 start_codon:yes stop_codon:yes gene_type:complete
MTTIIIDKDLNFSKTHFRNIEELQMEILLMNERSELSPEHIRILKEREKEADNATNDGFTFEELKASIRRKNG